LSQDASRTIWMTNPDGASQRVNEGQTFTRIGMSGKTLKIQTVLRDSQGTTWIGTIGQGLARIPAASHKLDKIERFSQSDGLSQDFVWCLLEDREHNIWVGTQNGLNRFRDEKVTTLTRREGVMSDEVSALAAGRDGAIWSSTLTGIHRIDGEHHDGYLEGTIVSGLYVDRNNTVWAGTNRGVARMQAGTWPYLPMPKRIDLTAVTTITGDDENGVWLFCAQGTLPVDERPHRRFFGRACIQG